MSVRVFVTVGTDHHRFDRLMDWLDDWASTHPEASLIVQHGASRPALRGENRQMMTQQELQEQYASADIVVAQVGPGTISDANRNGIRPITVPRDPSLDEVVDGHQFEFGEFMARQERCWTVTTEDNLVAILDRLITAPEEARITPLLSADSASANLAALADLVVRSPRRRFHLPRLVAMVRRPEPDQI